MIFSQHNSTIQLQVTFSFYFTVEFAQCKKKKQQQQVNKDLTVLKFKIPSLIFPSFSPDEKDKGVQQDTGDNISATI